MSDVILRLSVREAHEVRGILRHEVERGLESSFAGGSASASVRAFRYMVKLQDAIEEGHGLHDKEAT